MVLSDGVVRLRPYMDDGQDDARALAWYSDPEVLNFSEAPGTKPFSHERVQRMYHYLRTHGELYIIEVLDDGHWHPIGDVTLAPDTMPIVIGERSWRSRGVGSRVLTLLIRRARELGWESLQAKHIWTHNIRSQRLFLRHGFRRVESGVDDNGQSFDRYVLDLTHG